MLKYSKLEIMNENLIKNWENWRWTVTTKPAVFSDLARWTFEAQEIQRKYEQEKWQIKTETRELINKEKLIHQSKELIYRGLWINNELAKNGSLVNFTKWVIDWILIGNIELAIEIINTKWKVIIDWFSHLMSANWIKQIIEILKTNIWDFIKWNAYERWKASSELVVTTLVWVWMFKGIKSLTQIWIKWAKKVITAGWNLIEKAGKISLNEILQLPKEARIKAIARLDNLWRTWIIKWLIGRKISEVQEIAVIKAHEVWMDRIWAWIWTYTFNEILAKSRILKEALFTKEEVRLLMENWVCWIINIQESRTILERAFWIFKWEQWTREIMGQISLQIKDQLWVIPRIAWKGTAEVNKLLKWEFKIIKNAKISLKEIFKWMDIKDKFLFESINSKVNEWLSVRLANIEKFIIYMEESNLSKMSKQDLVWVTNHIRNKIISEWLSPLWDALKEQMNLWNLTVSYTNKAKMLEITRRIRAIGSFTIN